MRIACDVDGVVCDTMQGFVDLTNRLYHSNRKVSQITDWDLGISLDLTDEQVRTVFRRLDWFGLYPVPLAIETINELRRLHEVVFVTARRQDIPTAGWLSKFLATPVVHNVPASEKAAFCLDIGALVLVEDRPSEIEACEAVGFPTILLDQPWNREVDHTRRAYGWADVPVHIAAMQAAMEAVTAVERPHV